MIGRCQITDSFPGLLVMAALAAKQQTNWETRSGAWTFRADRNSWFG
jgi:hypothetical protein